MYKGTPPHYPMLDFYRMLSRRIPFGSHATSQHTDNFLPAYAIAAQPVVCRKLPSPKRFLCFVVVLENCPSGGVPERYSKC